MFFRVDGGAALTIPAAGEAAVLAAAADDPEAEAQAVRGDAASLLETDSRMTQIMTRGKLMRTIDRPLIEETIRRVERRTSGEIRVSVSSLFWGSVEKAAEKAFVRLGMTGTKQRNGVLFFVVPARRRLVVLGDQGVHEKVGREFWSSLIERVTERFRSGDFTGGLVAGIEEVADQLALYFPYEPSDMNELPEEVEVK